MWPARQTLALAESRARRGLPDEPALAEPAYDIVDAELVDDGPEMGPSSTGDACMRDGQVTGGAELPTAPPSGPASRPPGTGLQTLEDAAADANRATRIGHTSRVR